MSAYGTFTKAHAPGPTARLIEVLSWRTYPSLVSAIREVVSNSSDADATTLHVSISSMFDQTQTKIVYKLTFFDNGEGMTPQDFEEYLRLCGIGRRERTKSGSTPSARPIIGMLGIGSLAVAPWASRVEILTKPRNSTQIRHARIPYGEFFDNPSIRNSDLYGERGTYEYEQRVFDAPDLQPNEIEGGFTIIDLIDLRPEAKNELFNASQWSRPEHVDIEDLGLLGDNYHTHLASTARGQRRSFRQLPPLLQFLHRLALVIPVPYPEGTPVNHPPIRSMVGRLKEECMDSITFQGVALHRPMLILNQQNDEDRHSTSQGSLVRHSSSARVRRYSSAQPIVIDETLPRSKVHIRGYIWGQNTQIKFEELTGIQVRIKNVGIGP